MTKIPSWAVSVMQVTYPVKSQKYSGLHSLTTPSRESFLRRFRNADIFQWRMYTPLSSVLKYF